MNVKILVSCIGCGACAQIASEVFDINWHYAVLNEFKVADNEDLCIDAAIICPVGAIKIES